MEHKPEISVIVPVYNTEKYIAKCVESVFGQSFENLELICVNDGSSDGSLEILKSFAEKDERLVLIDKSNGGVSAARNDALKAARGEYVVFVDSDDWLDTDACEKAIAAAKEHNADVVMWPYKREFKSSSAATFVFGKEVKTWNAENVKKLHCRLVGPVREDLSTPHHVDSIGVIWSKLYRRELFDNTSFVDLKEIGSGEDVLFNIQVFENVKNACYIPDTFYHYRKYTEASLTSTYSLKQTEKWKKLFCRIDDFIKENNKPEIFGEALQNRIACNFIGLGFYIISYGKFSFADKLRELKRVLNLPHYKAAMSQIKLKYMPLHWKAFFFCAKHRFVLSTFCLLKIMRTLRKIV